MTFERFKELWDKAGLNNPPQFDNPTCVDKMSDETIDALCKAAEGNFRAFDEIDRMLFLRRTPEETREYFKKRFEKFKQ